MPNGKIWRRWSQMLLGGGQKRTNTVSQKCNKRNSNSALGFIFHHKGRQTCNRLPSGTVDSPPQSPGESCADRALSNLI